MAATLILVLRTGEFHDLRPGPMDHALVESLSETVDGNPHVRRINLSDAVDSIHDVQRRNSQP